MRKLRESFSANFNPLPPHGGRQLPCSCHCICIHFNPLPPHGGRRLSKNSFAFINIFQSTPSTRRETERSTADGLLLCISIHSLHTEGDVAEYNGKCNYGGFQSTPSTRRETAMRSSTCGGTGKFQSTPSTRRETC